MPDAQLTAALKQAKASKMFFVFIPKGSDGKLIVSKQKISPKAIAEAKDQIGGGSPVTGKCFGPSESMVFQVARASGTLGNAIKKAAQRDAGLKIIPDIKIGVDTDENDEGNDSAGAIPGAAAAKPAAPPDAKVSGIQKALKQLGYDPGEIDGRMGSHTQGAIMKFQAANGLKADGIVGDQTQAALTKAIQGGGTSADGKAGQPAQGAPAAAAASGGSAAAASGAKPPLPVPEILVKPGDEKGKLMDLAQALDSIKPIKGDFSDGAHYTITVGGKQVEINQQEVDTNRKNAQTVFAKAVATVQQRSSNAQDDYKIYRGTITTGKFGQVVTFIYDHTTVTDPGLKIGVLCGVANAQASAALGSANGNKFVTAANGLIAADTAAHQAHALMVAYKDGIESSAATTVTALEGVKLASEVTLAVGGAVVTGGATVGFAGGLGITAAEDLGPALSGGKVDWGKFAFDMALAIVTKKLGPGEQMEKAVLARLGTQTVEKVGEKVAKEAFAKVVGITAEALMKKSLETTQQALSGKDVSWDKFAEDTKKDLIKEYAVAVAKQLLKK